jgi:D-alanyl-D-alanine carboxypeptidase
MDLGPDLYAISCLRNTTYQRNLFCGNRSRGIPPAQRAETVAPPGYSEHHTGYAVDFGSAHVPQCQFRYCFGRTRAGEWLKHHAPEFGFEMSFPPGNVQGVAPEPWHWRWVGHGADPSSQRAQQIFWKARTRFPTPYGELAQGLLKK